MDGWDEGGGDAAVLLPASRPGGDARCHCAGVSGKTSFNTSSAEYRVVISKLEALSLDGCLARSSGEMGSLTLRLVGRSVTRVSVLPPTPSPVPGRGVPGKVMASRLAWLSLSAACHPVLPPGGERGQGRPTEAASMDVLRARWRSLVLGRSLRVTGVSTRPKSGVRTIYESMDNE